MFSFPVFNAEIFLLLFSFQLYNIFLYCPLPPPMHLLYTLAFCNFRAQLGFQIVDNSKQKVSFLKLRWRLAATHLIKALLTVPEANYTAVAGEIFGNLKMPSILDDILKKHTSFLRGQICLLSNCISFCVSFKPSRKHFESLYKKFNAVSLILLMTRL